MHVGVEIETSLGMIELVSVEHATKAFVSVGGRHRQDSGRLKLDGREYSIAASLSCKDGVWGLARTDAGNESHQALGLLEHGVRDGWSKSKTKAWHTVRDAVVAAVSAYFTAHPEVLVEAEREYLTRGMEQATEMAAGYEKKAKIALDCAAEFRAKLAALEVK